jgi:MFS family permease
LRAARAAVTATFFASGALYGSLFARIPELQDEAGLSNATLGAGLFALGLAALFAQPLAGAAATRIGARACVRAGAIVNGAALALPGLASTPVQFAIAVAFVGLGAGVIDVSMNVAAAEVEERSGKRMFSSFHAAYSFGAMTGAAIGGVVAQAGVGTEPHLALAGVLSAATVVVATRWMPRVAGHAGHAFARPTWALAALGAIAFCGLLAEGSVGDWSAVHLARDLDASPGEAAAGLTAFALCMALGRLAADPVAERIGPVAVVRGGGVLAVIGLVTALLADTPALAIAGFAVMGIGLAGTFPLALVAAARASGQSPAAAIAAVSTAGYTGLLLGPAVIGFIAHATTLPAALGGVVALCAVIVVVGGAARGPRAAAG